MVQAVGGVQDYSMVSLNRVQSAAYQKPVARKMAFTKWADELLVERRKRSCNYSFLYEYVRSHQTTRREQPPIWKAGTAKTNGI